MLRFQGVVLHGAAVKSEAVWDQGAMDALLEVLTGLRMQRYSHGCSNGYKGYGDQVQYGMLISSHFEWLFRAD